MREDKLHEKLKTYLCITIIAYIDDRENKVWKTDIET
jgi:hypothetical protein